MKLLDDYLALVRKIHNYFGYQEDWRVIPLDDGRDYYWYLDGEGPGTVHYADTEEELDNQDGNYYKNEIYTRRFLSLDKWVYRGDEFTMVIVNTHTDSNVFLRIYDNKKERPKCK